ncbi:DUF2726 domain-containing protein [Escherichia coli]|uniref:DUF2726 domain-containing protein n=1 Tax=Escherichia coli TaxID=562 RepID=UPI001A9358D7|nr:DUF2726 domain-containing protein [Escherichia coli]QSS48181.1 DUF2726 domain-containing protein [Escherichia coli]
MKGLFRIVDMKRWYLCPQVRVADIVQLNGNIRPRLYASGGSYSGWCLSGMLMLVIVERRSFSIVAAVELDDASHFTTGTQTPGYSSGKRLLRQAGIPLLRSHDARNTAADDRRMAEYNRG